MPRPNRKISLARLAFSGWTVVILAATVPWNSFVGHTHWQKVQWIPFVSPPVTPVDILGNILLYVPFGYAIIRAFPVRIQARHAVAIGGALSLAIEWSQLYSHSRFPSVQDVACNALGAWLGARARQEGGKAARQ